MMRKLFLLIILCFFMAGLFSAIAVRADYKSDMEKQLSATAGEKGAGYGQARDPRAMAAKVIQVLLGLLGMVFIAYTVYAGFLILTSRGEEEKVAKGKKVILYSTLGIIITFSAFSLASFANRYLAGNEGGISGGASSGAWYAGGSANIQGSTDQFYNQDPLEQSVW